MTGESGHGLLASLTVIAMVGLMVLSPASAFLGTDTVGTVSAVAPPDDGVHYVTDSGFEINDTSDGAVPRSGNPFPDSDTLALPGINLSSSGQALVTIDQRNGTFTNLSTIDDDPSITVTPDDKQTVALMGGFDSLNFSDATYDSSSSAVDFVYSTDSGATAAVRFENTGLESGDSVEAIDVNTDTTLDTTTVNTNGSVTFTELDTGNYTVNLRKPDTSDNTGSGGSSGGGGSTTSTSVASATGRISVSNPTWGERINIDGGGDGTVAALSEVDSIQVNRLSMDIKTYSDFTLDVTTFENDLTPSVGPDHIDANTQAQVESASASFEQETGTVSAGYVSVEHDLEPEELSDVTFEFSIRRSYLDGLDVSPEDVTLYRQHQGAWNDLETEYVDSDETYYNFEGTSPGFSVFALGTTATPIELTDASLAATTIDLGEEATVTATVENRGRIAGDKAIELTSNGTVLDSTTVTLDGGETETVTLSFEPDESGAYVLSTGAIELDQLTVESTEEATDGEATPEVGQDGTDGEETTDTADREDDSGALWAIVGLLAITIIVVSIVLWRRRKGREGGFEYPHSNE